MSSRFFQLAQSISSALVDFLPPEYDPLVDMIETTYVEDSHNIQKLLFRKNESNRNLVNDMKIEQIRDVRITIPEWLQHSKNEFYKNQNKREEMGLHVLAVAKKNECDRALRLLHARQSWSNNNKRISRNIRIKDRSSINSCLNVISSMIGTEKDVNLITSR
jgi:hypothetical protein